MTPYGYLITVLVLSSFLVDVSVPASVGRYKRMMGFRLPPRYGFTPISDPENEQVRD